MEFFKILEALKEIGYENEFEIMKVISEQSPDINQAVVKEELCANDQGMVYGYATAVDTGGALMSGEALVDVFYPTYDECVNWGRRNVIVYILD